MAFYIENAERRGVNVNETVKILKSMNEGEEVTLYGIRAIRHACCYSLWSSKGMMRLELDLDVTALALALITLLNDE